MILYGTNTSHPLAAGSSLDDVRLEVDLSVTGGIATMTFANVSVAPEMSAVFKTIVLDLWDNDTGIDIRLNPSADPADDITIVSGNYSVGGYNTLPGYGPAITDGSSMIDLNSANPATKKGLAPGDSMAIQFATTLANGSDIDDYLSVFNGGNDSVAYTVGFHAISTDTVNGESLSGVYVPEPATLSLIGIGALGMILKRKRA